MSCKQFVRSLHRGFTTPRGSELSDSEIVQAAFEESTMTLQKTQADYYNIINNCDNSSTAKLSY
ncbi:hypothetical protein Plhal304r1_c048g0130531 [Plasmopara halstedii]